MKKEQHQKAGRKRSDTQGDIAIKQTNQAQVPFLYLPVKDFCKKSGATESLKKSLYRVIKIK